MKRFKTPRMSMVRLVKEDIVTKSSCTDTYGECSPYYCNDCAQCNNAYDCKIFDCYSYTK